jgi:CHAD domain-containing protein
MNDARSPSDGKWVDGLTAATPAGKAARRAVAARLAAVRDALGPAAAWGPDPEPVHRLRVATRRAAAALDTFADLLPGKPARRARKTLKRLRRAAGAARDADVFLDGIRGWSVHQSPAVRPGLHFLLGHALAARQAAQVELAAAIEAASADSALPIEDLRRKERGGRKETLGERAAPTVAGLVDDLTAAAGRLPDTADGLHEVRIAAKRLRYSMELFMDCLPPAVREQVYPRVEAVQDVLGEANDCHTATLRLDRLLDAVRQSQPGLWDLVRGGIEEFRVHVGQRLREQRWAFADWWRRWQALRPDQIAAGVTPPASSAAAAAARPVPAPAS